MKGADSKQKGSEGQLLSMLALEPQTHQQPAGRVQGDCEVQQHEQCCDETPLLHRLWLKWENTIIRGE